MSKSSSIIPLEESPKVPTLKAVAELAKVSVPTASSVLNGHAGKLRIADRTRDRVLDVAEKLGYQANPFASSLRLKRSRSIGVIWSFSGPHGSNSLIRCVSEKAMRHGYNTLVHDSVGVFRLIESQLRDLAKRRVDGLVIQIGGMISKLDQEEYLSRLKSIPNVVMITDAEWETPFAQIVHSRTRALKDAVRHLLACGRRRFAFVGTLKAQGFKIGPIREALLEAGLNPDELVTLDLPASKIVSRESLKEVLSVPKAASVDAILTSTDEMAAAAISALRSQGRRIPEDVAIIGFNNSPIASLFEPSIASIERFDEEVATLAMERVIAGAERKALMESRIEAVEMKFIPRESAGVRPSSDADCDGRRNGGKA